MERITCANEIINDILKRVNRRIYLKTYYSQPYAKEARKRNRIKWEAKDYEESERGLNRQKKYRQSFKGKLKFKSIRRSYNTYTKSARKRGLMFEISKEYFDNIIQMECWYCGNKEDNGIDRVINDLPYIYGNCVTACKICNYMKSKSNLIDFISKCKSICNKHEL